MEAVGFEAVGQVDSRLVAFYRQRFMRSDVAGFLPVVRPSDHPDSKRVPRRFPVCLENSESPSLGPSKHSMPYTAMEPLGAT